MTMTHFKNPFTHASPVRDGLFVDRERELAALVSWFSTGHGSFVITGERGIGKTSLALKASHIAEQEASCTHVLYTSVYKFHARSFEVLLPELALELCISIWQKLFGGSFSELYEGSFPTAGKSIEKRHVSDLKRIYNILKAASMSAKASYFRSFGGKALIEAKAEEKDEFATSRKDLTIYEFLALIDELKVLCEAKGKSRIVVVADECNYLSDTEQRAFLQDFFEVLNSRKILFALIGVNLDLHSIPGLDQCVERSMPLGPFASPEHTDLLIREAITSCSDLSFFDADSIKESHTTKIHELNRGNPRLVQEFCFYFFYEIFENRVPVLTDQLLMSAIREHKYRQQEREHNRRITEG